MPRLRGGAAALRRDCAWDRARRPDVLRAHHSRGCRNCVRAPKLPHPCHHCRWPGHVKDRNRGCNCRRSPSSPSHRRRILLLVFRPFNSLPVYMCLEGASLTSLAFSPSLFKFSVELCPKHRGRGGWRWSVGDDGRVRRRAATTHIWFSPVPPARRQHLRFPILSKDSRALAAQTTFSSCPSTRS